jgi:hypothetical protein
MEEEPQDLDVADATLHFSGKKPMELASLIEDAPYFYLEKVKYLPADLYSNFLLSISMIKSPSEVFDAIDFVVIIESLSDRLGRSSINSRDREVAQIFIDNIKNNIHQYAESAPWHINAMKLFEECVNQLKFYRLKEGS